MGLTTNGEATLDVARTLRGARIVILGGTGFLGKVFWSMLLDRYPDVGRIYLVVRPKKGATPEQRFWSDVASSEALGPLRRAHGDGYAAFLRDKIVPIDGDMSRALCGLDAALVRELAGTIDAVINVAGVVDFNPPLDEAIAANAFGAQNLVALARALDGEVHLNGNGHARNGTSKPHRRTAIYHTSTCYVAGQRLGPIYEDDPRTHPFPRAAELGVDAWDPDREIAECLDLVAQAKHRSDDAFRQSEFAEAARKNLASRGEPVHGPAYDAELARVKRRFVAERVIEGGLDRATHWGWPNIYTYTKSIGEQVIARSGVPFTIARPACCESCEEFPERSYSEGINTSSPLIYLIMKGQVQILAGHVPLDLIPTDMVVGGMILALAELVEGTAPPVYQFGASDVNPCTAQRFGEMSGMYKRKYLQRGGGGNPLVDALAARIEPSFVGRERFDRVGPAAIASAARGLASFMRGAVPALAPAARALEDASRRTDKIAQIQKLFEPFASKVNGPFDCSNTRAAFARATDADKARLRWAPESIDWMDWMMNVHMPAIEKRVIPEMDRRLKKPVRPLEAHATLISLVDQMAERHDLGLALQQMTADGLTRTTFRDIKRGSEAAAARLAALGVRKGDRVALAGRSHPDWALAYFGIVRAGATAVPVDPGLDADGWRSVLAESEALVVVWDETVAARGELAAGDPALVALELHDAALPDDGLAPPDVAIEPGDVASLLFTSGTTARPKGVMLTHANFTSLVAALAPVFPLSRGDAVLSVLPLHHTFEFTCGLLLPLSRGARVVYVGERTGDGVAEGLRAARATAMVGVPALWQLLERRILSQVDARGPLARAAFDAATEANRWLGANVGIDVGRVLFGAVHDRLGGRMKWLISGGAALPSETQELFFGLGLRLTQGYGLTEAAPVLTVTRPSGRLEPGVGKPLPGVELRVDAADGGGVGEIVARGANVMIGYTDAQATSEAIDAEGWLHTGDVGRIDRKGRLEILGRLKDVVIAPNGENVYPDDVERRLGAVPYVAELAVVGVVARGGERVACLAVPAGDEGAEDARVGVGAGARARAGANANEASMDTRSLRAERARAALRAAIERLPPAQRPAIVHLYHAPLPRTATRKVKRDEVRAILTRLATASARPENGAGEATPARAVIAGVCGVPLADIAPASVLRGELGFDSLLMTELLEALETRFGALDPARLEACVTAGDVDELVGQTGYAAQAGTARTPARRDAEAPIVLPEPVQEAGRALLGKAQDFFYGEVMKPRVYGRAHIPHNRNTIVIANHASHLDMGLVRHALGRYGEGIVSLAAQDYFFEGRVKRAFFENLTNLRAIDRKASLRQSIRQASELLGRGKTLLIFPEGTRSANGELQEFKPLVGHLALAEEVDLLPIHLGGTHAAMPKGAPVPIKRELVARIGPPLCVSDLRRLTAGMTPADAAREVSRIARAAVSALRDGQVLDLGRAQTAVAAEPDNPLIELFAELETKFRAGEVEKSVSYYVSLGNDDLAKWTVRVDAARCDVRPGKPQGGEADCVLKTSPEIFAKIVRESYVPTPGDFMSGVFKSNDVALLMTFQRVFQLDQPS
jgi:long-chain acyl-CoA synthetase